MKMSEILFLDEQWSLLGNIVLSESGNLESCYLTLEEKLGYVWDGYNWTN